jgi:hypothetical protein
MFTLRNYAGNIFTYYEPAEEGQIQRIVPDRNKQAKKEVKTVEAKTAA